ncbi:Fc.00g049830.m01.CDS01 [Cosmosporella sp. VM-42]
MSEQRPPNAAQDDEDREMKLPLESLTARAKDSAITGSIESGPISTKLRTEPLIQACSNCILANEVLRNQPAAFSPKRGISNGRCGPSAAALERVPRPNSFSSF